MNNKTTEWLLRVAVAGEFFGHAMFALQGKADWVKWVSQLTGAGPEAAISTVTFVGILDIIVALVVLVKPMKAVLLWAIFWGFFTALVRPLVGLPIWDFVERFANWGAPLALLALLGYPKNFRELLKS